MTEHQPREVKKLLAHKESLDQEKRSAPSHQPLDIENASVLDLHHAVGNQGVQRLLAEDAPNTERKPSTFIQTKLTVGAADDQYEREADSVAQQIMTMPDEVQRQEEEEVMMQRDDIQRQEEEEEVMMQRDDIWRQEEEEEMMQPKRDDIQRDADLDAAFEVGGAVEDRLQSQKGGGQSLPDETRGFFEDRFGHDFSNVKVHSGGESDMLNRSLNARAFTTGTDIFFKKGEFSPKSGAGKELLAHELTHVVQQGGAGMKKETDDK